MFSGFVLDINNDFDIEKWCKTIGILKSLDLNSHGLNFGTLILNHLASWTKKSVQSTFLGIEDWIRMGKSWPKRWQKKTTDQPLVHRTDGFWCEICLRFHSFLSKDIWSPDVSSISENHIETTKSWIYVRRPRSKSWIYCEVSKSHSIYGYLWISMVYFPTFTVKNQPFM